MMLKREEENCTKVNYAKFICGICGKPHQTIVERAMCELECSKRLERESEMARQRELKAQKQKRFNEINSKTHELQSLISSYVKDYEEPINFMSDPSLVYRIFNKVL